MWKIISLFTLLVLTQAGDIHDIYGDWWIVAFYPVPATRTVTCMRFSFAKSTKEEQCTYADGRNATLVQVTTTTEKGQTADYSGLPMLIVNTPAEVMPALNISLKCDGKDVRDFFVVRLVNENYFISYTNLLSMEYARSEIEQNSANLYGRNPLSSTQLGTVVMGIEDLKNRRGVQMCGTENVGGFKSTEYEMRS